MTVRAFARLTLLAVLVLPMPACASNAPRTADTAPDLRTLVRPSAPNNALACPPGACAAKADMDSPAFPTTRAALIEAATAVFLAEPRTVLTDEDAALGQRVFVQRSRVFGFADTIRVQVAGAGGAAALILYSRSNLGYWDFGVNRARLRDWLAKLEARMAPAR